MYGAGLGVLLVLAQAGLIPTLWGTTYIFTLAWLNSTAPG